MNANFWQLGIAIVGAIGLVLGAIVSTLLLPVLQRRWKRVDSAPQLERMYLEKIAELEARQSQRISALEKKVEELQAELERRNNRHQDLRNEHQKLETKYLLLEKEYETLKQNFSTLSKD